MCRLSRVGRLTHVYSLRWARAMMSWDSTQKLRRWVVLIPVGCYVAVDETAVHPHLPVTPTQLVNPGIGWNTSLCSVWLCITCNLYALFQEDVVRWLFMYMHVFSSTTPVSCHPTTPIVIYSTKSATRTTSNDSCDGGLGMRLWWRTGNEIVLEDGMRLCYMLPTDTAVVKN